MVGWKDSAEKYWRHFAAEDFLESVNFELVCPDESDLCHPVTDVVALVTLKLKNLSVLRMLHYRSIASKLLKKKRFNYSHCFKIEKRVFLLKNFKILHKYSFGDFSLMMTIKYVKLNFKPQCHFLYNKIRPSGKLKKYNNPKIGYPMKRFETFHYIFLIIPLSIA